MHSSIKILFFIVMAGIVTSTETSTLTVDGTLSMLSTSTTSTTTSSTTTETLLDTADATEKMSAVVFNPSTATVTTTMTAGYVSTITDATLPPLTLVPEPVATTAMQTDTLWIGGATIQPTKTVTHTLLEATYYMKNTAGYIYATSTAALLIAATGISKVEETEDEFDSWSDGAKAGLITGIVLAALIILWLLICCYKRNARWIAHDWRWAPHVEGSYPAMANANLAHPPQVMSPLTVVSSTPSYTYGHPAYSYARGGPG